ncbi:Lrp/AsnC family transcriptional regulator [Winogradskya consettensis]|uniref:AsnC family transcriptional regulator n=1 Tax=Winogradskya consettensis TaxID=113560 RepID=A0A919S7L5_9ACTN|nr:Lrp/AsnC family transcriptional regulator [Actinoplanes consettensis]GIM66319.1 AsnC family transcriptional regulator [Actinoplanes consettensis]
MDDTDIAILECLQDDGRISNLNLAARVSLSPSACLRRLRALEETGIIAGYRTELDRERLGLDLTIFIELKVERHSQKNSQKVEAALIAIPAVVACHIISGNADFLVEVAAPSLAAYERILIDQILIIDTIVDARSTFAIRTVKSRGPLPLGHLANPA